MLFTPRQGGLARDSSPGAAIRAVTAAAPCARGKIELQALETITAHLSKASAGADHSKVSQLQAKQSDPRGVATTHVTATKAAAKKEEADVTLRAVYSDSREARLGSSRPSSPGRRFMAADIIVELIDAAEHQNAERVRLMIQDNHDQLAESQLQIKRQRVQLDRRAAALEEQAAALAECQVALAASTVMALYVSPHTDLAHTGFRALSSPGCRSSVLIPRTAPDCRAC